MVAEAPLVRQWWQLAVFSYAVRPPPRPPTAHARAAPYPPPLGRAPSATRRLRTTVNPAVAGALLLLPTAGGTLDQIEEAE